MYVLRSSVSVSVVIFFVQVLVDQGRKGVNVLQHPHPGDVLLHDHSEDGKHSQAPVLELPELHPLPCLLGLRLEPEGVEAQVAAHGAKLLLLLAPHLNGEDREDDLDEGDRALLVHLRRRGGGGGGQKSG